MESALIVSCTDKSADFFSEVLNTISVNKITVLNSAEEARRHLMERDFDFIIVDAPLADESGEDFSRNIASKSLSQVILAVKNEHFNKVAAVCEEDGVLAISKPVNKEIFSLSLSLAKAANSRIKRIHAENAKLKQKIKDIRIIDRAKLLLISYLNLSEQEAHRFIEKQAMDLRTSKRMIAEGILKTYAS
ncbi:MAG: ANTAR domain-containing protein [Treponema sp.]|jgi:response regulator NasT|nr:ANTAR domain-containing protein [Treponema sp.]